MMNWLRNFMAGRYGSDQLSWATLILYLVLSLMLPRDSMLQYLSLIPLLLFWYRFLSRDLMRRSAENQLFLEKTAPVRQWFQRKSSQLRDKEHRYYACPGCHQTLRVPRNRGKLTITCPKCQRSITKNT